MSTITNQVNGQVKQTAMKMFKKKMLPFPEPIRKFLWLDIIKNSAKKSESKGSKKSKVLKNLASRFENVKQKKLSN